MSRVRRWLAIVLCAIGVGLLGHTTLTYARAELLRREMRIAPLVEPQPPRPGDLIATLEIPRLAMCDPVFEGDDDAVLARGVGHLPDTPLPWEDGNAALAGHRDTVFRPLSRIRSGDVIAVTSARGRYEYQVRETRVVEPGELSVLRDTATPTLTLITCYPFRWIGPAPNRFIVRAERVSVGPGDQQHCGNGSGH